MIIRIVKMQFRKDEIGKFLEMFENVKEQIRNFDGCMGLSLLEDVSNPSTLFTYSYWNSEDHLNQYRASELFEKTWEQTKSKFSDKPYAWTLSERSSTLGNKSGSKQFNV